MKLDYFYYLLEVNRLHSISAAARSLHISQTTLSAIVKSTEARVGFPIFQRTLKGVIPTSCGEQFMPLAWEINAKYEELIRLKRRMEGGAPLTTLLLSPMISYCLSVPLAKRFSRLEPHCSLTFQEVDDEQIGQHILDNGANVGLAYLHEDEIQRLTSFSPGETLCIERLFQDRVCLLTGARHPLAGEEAVDAAAACRQRIAAVNPLTTGKILGSMVKDCPSVTTFSDMDNVYHALLEQDFVTFMPSLLCSFVSSDRYRAMEIKNTQRDNRLYFCLITCRDRNLRYLEHLLSNCVREQARDMIRPPLPPENARKGGPALEDPPAAVPADPGPV